MKLFDSHSHIDDTCFDDDFEDVLQRAGDAGVEAIMIAGISVETTKKAIRLAAGHDNLFTAVGIHPHDAKECSDQTIEELKSLAKNPCVKAWGEIGLDFNRMFSPAPVQEKWLKKQMEAADALDLPIIFHERDSKGRFLEIIQEFSFKKPQGVVHCFSGSKKEMFRYLDLGYYIGITGILTIKQRGAYLRELAVMIPEDRIVIETDAPYLTPAPQKNKTRRNEPAFVKSVMTKLAQLKERDPAPLSEKIWNNTCNLFNIQI
ncbi:MAG: TatD family hydrolase [Thermodesulfobacteriota bacterium]|nr:TatD family hydrolase [Thermodesulfobacteriota bacterium]